MWVIALHNLFLCSDQPPLRPLLPIGSGYFRAENFLYKYPIFSSPVKLHTYTPMKMEQTQCSETLVFKLHTPVNHPEESVKTERLNVWANLPYALFASYK
jgi:hypothetical protein